MPPSGRAIRGDLSARVINRRVKQTIKGLKVFIKVN